MPGWPADVRSTAGALVRISHLWAIEPILPGGPLFEVYIRPDQDSRRLAREWLQPAEVSLRWRLSPADAHGQLRGGDVGVNEMRPWPFCAHTPGAGPSGGGLHASLRPYGYQPHCESKKRLSCG